MLTARTVWNRVEMGLAAVFPLWAVWFYPKRSETHRNKGD